jgi:hypothetical protein
MSAHLTAAWLKWPEHRWAISRLGLQLLGIYYPRRMLQAPFDPDIEWRLAWAELNGALAGPARYLRGRARVGAGADRHIGRVAARTEKHGATVATVDLSAPVPECFACSGDMLEIHVVDQQRNVGAVSIAAKGGRVSGLEVVDAIIARFDAGLLDPAGKVRGEIERLLHASLDPVREAE